MRGGTETEQTRTYYGDNKLLTALSTALTKSNSQCQSLRNKVLQLQKKIASFDYIDGQATKDEQMRNLIQSFRRHNVQRQKFNSTAESQLKKNNDIINQRLNQSRNQLQSQMRKEYSAKIIQYQNDIIKLRKQNNQLKGKNIDQQFCKSLQTENSTISKLLKETQENHLQLSNKLLQNQQKYNQDLVSNNNKLSESQNRQRTFIESQTKKIKGLQEQLEKSKQNKVADTILNQTSNLLKSLQRLKQLEDCFQSQEWRNQINSYASLFSINSTQTNTLISFLQKNQFDRKLTSVLDRVDKEKQVQQSLKGKKQQQQDQLRRQIDSDKAKISSLSSEAEKLKAEKIQLETKNRGQIEKISSTISRLTFQLKSQKQGRTTVENKLKSDIAQLKNEVSQCREQKTAVDKKLSEESIKLKASEQKCKQLEREIEQKCKQLERDIIKFKAMVQELQSTVTQLNSQIERLKLQLKKSKQEIQKKQRQWKIEKQRLQGETRYAKNTISQSETQNKNLKIEISSTKSSLSRAQQSLSETESNLSKTKASLSDTQANLSKVSIQLEESLSEKKKLQKYELGCKVLANKFLPQLSYELAKEKLSFDLDQPQKSGNTLTKWFLTKFNQQKYFMDSEIVERSHVQFLIEQLTNFNRNSIQQTKLMYRYDPKSKQNFHVYLDQIDNVLVLVKLQTNYIIGGYSNYSIEKHKDSPRDVGLGRGFIFSLTALKAFTMKNDAKIPVLTPDTYFFIFGGSEIRLRTGSKECYSNFGVAATTYDNKGFPRHEFLGVRDPKCTSVDFLTFEFYQIRFKS